jgi:hypothetical protein
MYYALAMAMYGFVGYKQEMDSNFFNTITFNLHTKRNESNT